MKSPKPSGRPIPRLLLIAVAATFAAAGATGNAVAQARAELAGTKAAAGSGWNLYRDFNFNGDSDTIRVADATKAREVAEHLNSNPGHRVGLDGMSQRRIGIVRDALINAGVPATRIQTGAFGEPGMRGARRVLVMVGY